MKTIDTNDLVIRIMKEEDLEHIIEIDKRISGRDRTAFFRGKLVSTLSRTDHLVTSLVAEYEGNVVGFIMANVYLGEFGVPETTAFIDTIGVAPDYQRSGIARTLMERFQDHLKTAGVETVMIRVDWNDWGLLRFFESQGFSPAHSVNLSKSL